MSKHKPALRDVELTTHNGEVKIRLFYTSPEEPEGAWVELLTIPPSSEKLETHITTIALKRALGGERPLVVNHGRR